MHAGPLHRRHRRTAHPVQQPRVSITNRRVRAAIGVDSRLPRLAARLHHGGVIQLRTVQLVAVQVDDDLIAILEQPDRKLKPKHKPLLDEDVGALGSFFLKAAGGVLEERVARNSVAFLYALGAQACSA